MIRWRPPTSADPWQAELERLDYEYEKTPASERPPFPPNPLSDRARHLDRSSSGAYPVPGLSSVHAATYAQTPSGASDGREAGTTTREG